MQKEVWKGVKEYPNIEVSNFGRLRNKKTNRILKQSVSEWGYKYVHLFNGHHANKYVHKLVAEAFLPNPEKKPQVNHIDGNKFNNNLENLEWVTYSENNKHAYDTGLKNSKGVSNRHPNIKIIETGEIFDSYTSAANILGCSSTNVQSALLGKSKTCCGYHLTYLNESTSFLRDYQMEAVKKMHTGCILNGGVGSGKSRTSLYYYFSKYGGKIENQEYTPMRHKPKPPDLYIITTAMKRDSHEWEGELAPFLLSTDPKKNDYYGNKVVIDSWQNIKKYADVLDSFFIWDEDKICGSGTWAKTFLKIAKHNEWIVLSASPGDKWQDYETIFIANGFFRNRTEMREEHYKYSRYTKFPKVEGYYNETRLIRLRDKILIDMDFKRHTIPHHEDIYVEYDIPKYKEAIRKRWDPYKDEPILQASGLCYVLRRIVSEDESRQIALLELFEKHPKIIVFYNFNYERDILLKLGYGDDVEIAEWSGHAHQPIPESKKWVYLVQYTAGCEGWNCIKTDTIVFYSQNYSYKVMLQACGRIDRLNTPYTDLYYYHIKSRSGIDLAISRALANKKKFNEKKWVGWD